MIVFLNGRFVSEARARISVVDRGFLYGDGLFETVLVCNSRPFRLEPHLDRLQRGAALLKIPWPHPIPNLESFAAELIHQNAASDAVLRIHLSRGRGLRGYSTRGAGPSTLVMSLHPPPLIDPANPPCWQLTTSLLRIPPDNPLACAKTSNRLVNIMARTEAEELNADDALLLNTREEIAGTAGANLFWVGKGRVYTPPLGAGALDGITRAVVFELCRRKSMKCLERTIPSSSLKKMDGVFVTLGTLGIVEILCLDGMPLKRSPITARLREAYWKQVTVETSHTTSQPNGTVSVRPNSNRPG